MFVSSHDESKNSSIYAQPDNYKLLMFVKYIPKNMETLS